MDSMFNDFCATSVTTQKYCHYTDSPVIIMVQNSLRTRAHRAHTPHVGSTVTSNYV